MRWWFSIVIRYEDKDYVITPANKLFKGMANVDTSWRYSWFFFTPTNILFQKGWRIVIPYEDKVDAMPPISILFIEGGELWSLMKIKLMFLPQPTYCSYEVAILIRYEDKDDVIIPTNILFKGVANFWSPMTIKLMLSPQSTNGS